MSIAEYTLYFAVLIIGSITVCFVVHALDMMVWKFRRRLQLAEVIVAIANSKNLDRP